MKSENLPRALGAALHDQRGHLGNIVVALSLLKRKGPIESDPALQSIVQRIETASDGVLHVAKLLQLLVECERPPYPNAEASLGALIDAAMSECGPSSDHPPVRVMGGDDSLRLPLTRQTGPLILASFFDAARALSGPGDAARVMVTERDGFVVLESRIATPYVEVADVDALFDGAWEGLGKSGVRGAPLAMYAGRRGAEWCGGSFDAERSSSGGLLLTMRLPHISKSSAS